MIASFVERILTAAVLASPTLQQARAAGARVTLWWEGPRLVAAHVIAECLPAEVDATLRAAGCYVTGDEYSDVYWLGRDSICGGPMRREGGSR